MKDPKKKKEEACHFCDKEIKSDWWACEHHCIDCGQCSKCEWEELLHVSK